PRPVGKMVFTTNAGPGGFDAKGEWNSKHPATAPLPRPWGRFEGLYLSGKRVVLSYTLGDVQVRESPWLETVAGQPIITRDVEIAPSKGTVNLFVGESFRKQTIP